MLRKLVSIFSICVLGSFAAGMVPKSAQAAYIVNLDEVGPNVVATGGGTIDLADLVPEFNDIVFGFIQPKTGSIATGPSSFSLSTVYDMITGPSSLGTADETNASSGTGDIVGEFGGVKIFVPTGYISKTVLSDTSTYDNQTFATLGVTPGTYVWTWGTGADADSFTLQIGPTAVPEPGSLALLLTGLCGLLGIRVVPALFLLMSSRT